MSTTHELVAIQDRYSRIKEYIDLRTNFEDDPNGPGWISVQVWSAEAEWGVDAYGRNNPKDGWAEEVRDEIAQMLKDHEWLIEQANAFLAENTRLKEAEATARMRCAELEAKIAKAQETLA